MDVVFGLVMSAVALGVAAALVALRCQLITDDPYVLGSVSRVIPATRPAFLRALNATRRLIGCPVEGDVEEPEPPFAGGQCDGVCYRFGVRTVNLNGTQAVNFYFARGPILGIRVIQQPGGNAVEVNARSAAATNTCSQLLPQGFRPGFGGGGAQSASIEQLTRVDGQPDDCGSLPGVYPPSITFNTDIDITYEGDDGNEITVNVPFIFAPITANFDGTLRIPFTLDLGGFEFSGDINLPDFDVTINPPRINPGSNDDLTPVGDDQPGDTIPPANPDEKVIGVVVNAELVNGGRVSEYFSPGIPPIFVPRIGSVKFAYSIGAATFWSSDIDIKDGRTFIECPFSQGADAVVASPQPGVNLTFVPIRGFPLATTRDVLEPA